MLARQFVTDALTEIGIVGADETVDPSDADLGLRYLQAMVDQFQADRLVLYIVNRFSYTLPAGSSSILISPSVLGPGPQWTAPVPVFISYLTVTPVGGTVEYPVDPWHVKEDFYRQPDKTTPSAYPSRYLYERTSQYGRFLFWPVPTTAPLITIASPQALTAPLTLDTDLQFPGGGYYECWRLQLAQRLQRPFLIQADPSLRADAAQALALVRRLNDETPPFSRADPAVQQGMTWNIYTGGFR